MADDKTSLVIARLHIVETVARLGSFSAAATALGMTQPAISTNIAYLEDRLGVKLFQRRHRGVTLTDAGTTLHEAARTALSSVQSALDRIDTHKPPASLTVLTDYAFASDWLAHRLERFETLCPEAEIRLLTAQSGTLRQDQSRTDPRPDISILFTDAPPPGDPRRHLLFPEIVHPVCTPAFAERHGPFDTAASLARACRLHLLGPAGRWCTWNDWFAAIGPKNPDMPLPSSRPARSYGNYPLLMQAVLRGEGIALGWRPIVDHHVTEGRLVQAWPEPLSNPARASRGYVLEDTTAPTRTARLFRAWLFEEVGNTTSLTP